MAHLYKIKSLIRPIILQGKGLESRDSLGFVTDRFWGRVYNCCRDYRWESSKHLENKISTTEKCLKMSKSHNNETDNQVTIHKNISCSIDYDKTKTK